MDLLSLLKGYSIFALSDSHDQTAAGTTKTTAKGTAYTTGIVESLSAVNVAAIPRKATRNLELPSIRAYSYRAIRKAENGL